MAERYATADDLPGEFASVAAGDVTFWLTATQSQISLDVWGENASIAHALLTAHRLKRANLGSNPSTARGPVTSQSVGNVSTSFAASAANGTDGDLASTIYGQAYADMRKGLGFTPIAIRSDEEPHIPR